MSCGDSTGQGQVKSLRLAHPGNGAAPSRAKNANSNRVLPPLGLCSDLKHFDSLRTDQLSIKEFQSKVSDLVMDSKFLCQCSKTDRASADEPVVTEIPEGNRLLTTLRIRHEFGDLDWLPKNGIVVVIPDVISIGILDLTE